ncbi:hypothetical protein HPB51_013026 [Rhipicephalus microplus]|uniref:Tick transposon n=1 Tax=Rhipicephalus microplus TaxID=6941 RepID=A0A9J6F439_RHIMP|nr:hypothetical protein HPB51_013026 [Rhipicephalus microplus]
MPNLTFTKNVRAIWDNLTEAKAPRKFKVTDWDQFHKIKEKGSTELLYEAHLNELKIAANEAIDEVEIDESIQAMDSHLASLLQKKHDLKDAWHKNKLNRRLHTNIMDIGSEIESPTKTLSTQQWNNTCDEPNGKMRKGSKWGLLKHLMGDSDKPTRGGTQQQIERSVHKHAQEHGGSQALLTTLGEKYLPLERKAAAWENENPSYIGQPQKKVDEPFREAEIRYALQQLNGRSARESDGIDNKLLQN